MQLHETADLAARLDRLEKQNRRLRWMALALLVTGGLGFLVAADAPKNQTVEASKFVLRDADGQARATLAMDPQVGPVLTFMTAKGTSRAKLALLDSKGGDPVLTLHDEKGATRGGLTISGGAPMMLFLDQDQKMQMALGVDSGKPSLVLQNAAGTRQLGLGLEKDGPLIQLTDPKGQAKAALSVTADGPHLTLTGKDGTSLFSKP
jgi:hypothetical protein